MTPPTFHYLVRAIVERDGRFLLTREKGSAFSFLPGGHVEPGEPAVTALRRELREVGFDARGAGGVGPPVRRGHSPQVRAALERGERPVPTGWNLGRDRR